MNRADAYAAFARIFFPRDGDPGVGELLAAVPGGDVVPPPRAGTIAGEHLRVFGPSLAASSPPYETFYGAGHVFMQTQQLADIAGFYRAFGLVPPTEERVDHLASELEFMHVLLCLEAAARAEGRADHADVCLQAQRRFLSEHLGRWTGAFAARLRESEGPGFYAAAGEALARFVASECGRLDARPVAVGPNDLRLPEQETDDSCGSCTLANAE